MTPLIDALFAGCLGGGGGGAGGFVQALASTRVLAVRSGCSLWSQFVSLPLRT